MPPASAALVERRCVHSFRFALTVFPFLALLFGLYFVLVLRPTDETHRAGVQYLALQPSLLHDAQQIRRSRIPRLSTGPQHSGQQPLRQISSSTVLHQRRHPRLHATQEKTDQVVLTPTPRPVVAHALHTWEGAELLSADPEAWILRRVLNSDECHALVHSAEAGQLRWEDYRQPEGGVLLQWDDLLPRLALLSSVAGVTRATALLQHGEPMQDALIAGIAVAGAFCALASGLAQGVRTATAAALGGKVFTGTKWYGLSAERGSAAAATIERFVTTLEQALLCDRRTLEPPTVTRYRVGEQQRVHVDARVYDTDFRSDGGQRLVQAVCYLKSCERGGETKFHHAAMRYLAVPPTQGDMLVFFPAFADGEPDDRMPHSGEKVLEGEKWILNTWRCQETVPGAPWHLTRD
eukprot:gnl/TRDRNA2_/TRDRNA2_204721_c0_seq1.p1 gnl/TRDRNA2_/TRDRNA2_204721_c0~~gnl/TRDRNA2_/TRDRNA2_204721_c0_seq1.p1  ORF type:complete len:408 (+),score=56.14 gnl/TRDRNA2_/TRDRNA2_204721_c0_seq1:76-1299(+)